MGLYQKQSLLLDGKARVGLERLAAGNAANEGQLSEGDFILWGFDSAFFSQQRTINYHEEELTIYGEGLVQVRGNEACMLNTFMEVDGSGWDRDIRNYALVIDRSGAGVYPPGETEIYYADYVDGNHVLYFTGLHWDSDRNGKDLFCFAYRPLPESASSESNRKTGTLNKEGEPGKSNPGGLQGQSNRYQLYPNPNRGDFRLEVQYDEPSDISVMIYSPDGKLIQTLSGSSQSSYFFEESLPVRGHYLIDIQGGGERKSFKMIVQ